MIDMEPVPNPAEDLRQKTKLVYILYIANIVVPFTGIIGVIIAYSALGRAPMGPRSHLVYQIRTFWIGLLYSVIVVLLCFVFVGFLLIPVLALWYLARSIVGLIRANDGLSIDNPRSWIAW